jgi:hypothetical protein
VLGLDSASVTNLALRITTALLHAREAASLTGTLPGKGPDLSAQHKGCG